MKYPKNKVVEMHKHEYSLISGLTKKDTFDSNLPETIIEEKRGSKDVCFLPIRSNPSRCAYGVAHKRWYYQEGTKKCKWFTGCAEGGNNFPSKTICDFWCLNITE